MLANDPQLLLLDEPTAGMTRDETAGTEALVRRVARSRQLTTIVIEHDIGFVRALGRSHHRPPQGKGARGRLGRSRSRGIPRFDAFSWGNPDGLERQQVTGGYGPVPVIHDVSLDVADGESVALLGRNGAARRP